MKHNQRTTPSDILLALISTVKLHGGIFTKLHARLLSALLLLWLAIPGRLNFTNLARYGEHTERSYRTWFTQTIPCLDLNAALVLRLQEQNDIGEVGILATDAVFIPKSGNKTPGVAKFWSGCLSKAESGLEGSCVTWVDVEKRQPIPLGIKQTPAVSEEGTTRVHFYAHQIVEILKALPETLNRKIKAVVGDAYYAKKVFLDIVTTQGGKHVVSKLRSDANLRYLFTGPKTGKRGRPQAFDGKVDFKNLDFSRWEQIPWADEGRVYSLVVNAVRFERSIRVVALVWPNKKGCHLELLFSTDTEMDAGTVIQLYRTRFPMEYPFRDAKQFAGLTHSQSRQPLAIDFHWNMSMLTVSLARAAQLENLRAEQEHQQLEGERRGMVFSMEDEKRRAYNNFFAQRIISMLPVNLSWEKCQSSLEKLLSLGVKAA